MGTEGKRTCCSRDFIFGDLILALYCLSDTGIKALCFPITEENSHRLDSGIEEIHCQTAGIGLT